MNIKVIGKFRFAIEDAVKILTDLDKKYTSLPSLEDLDHMIAGLQELSSYDVVASIYEDGDFKSNKDTYLNAFGGVLNCSTFVGVVSVNGDTYDYWHGMTEKLEKDTTYDPDCYTDKVEQIRELVGALTEAMRRDLECVFEDTKLFNNERTQGRKKGSGTNRRPDREVKDTDFPTEAMEGVDKNFKISTSITDTIRNCIYSGTTDKQIRTALLTCSPDVISNGNRLEILSFMFKRFAKCYIREDEQRKLYLCKCREQFKIIKADFDFDKSSPNKEIKIKFWPEIKKYS